MSLTTNRFGISPKLGIGHASVVIMPEFPFFLYSCACRKRRAENVLRPYRAQHVFRQFRGSVAMISNFIPFIFYQCIIIPNKNALYW